MKRFLLLLLMLLVSLSSQAQELVTATITAIDIPNDGDSIVVNGNTRRWTNAPLNAISWISITNTLEATTTNLFLQVAGTPYTGLSLGYSSSAAIKLQGSVVSVSFAGTWASVSYATQLVTSLINVRVPVAGLPAATNRTFVGVELLKAINNYATNAFDNNAPALTNYLSLGPSAQSVTGPKLFESIGGTNTTLYGGIIDGATITNANYAGTMIALSGGIWTSPILQDPTLTNGVNYGTAFSSRGTATGSEQFGLGAEASGLSSFASGQEAMARADAGTALGNLAYVATNAYGGIAIGLKAETYGGRDMALGTGAGTYATNAIALGDHAASSFTNAYAIGTSVSTTAADQIRLGNSGHTLSLPGQASFGQMLAVGNSEFADWISSMNRGIILINGAAPDAAATNGWALYSEAGQAFYRTGGTDEGAEQNNRLHNRGATITGTGTAYSLTTGSSARVDFSGQDAELALPSAGTYQVIAKIEIVNGGTANDEYRFKLRNFEDDLDITDSESATSSMAASAIGQLVLVNTITVNEAKTIALWGFNSTDARGTVTAAHTSLTYVRLY